MNNQKITADTIARTVFLAVTLLNQCLTQAGKNPLAISETEIYTMISTGAVILASVLAWWKNNSFTQAAIKADTVMKSLK